MRALFAEIMPREERVTRRALSWLHRLADQLELPTLHPLETGPQAAAAVELADNTATQDVITVVDNG